MKPIRVRGSILNHGERALICTALLGKTCEALLAELDTILPKCPDIIEWRVDAFTGIADTSAVLAAAVALREKIGTLPLIFTRRAAHEGGAAVTISEDEVVLLYERVCASHLVDFIDYELSQAPAHLARLRAASRAQDIGMVMSHHDFATTPPSPRLRALIDQAVSCGADVAKLAVMPQSPLDVLRLLEVTYQASRDLPIPLITMSMGAMGSMSRVYGAQFGSALTFALGASASAPGQISIETLRVLAAQVPNVVTRSTH